MGIRIREALGDTPVVFLGGGRQTGKSTLARSMVGSGRQVTLDSAITLAAARSDPEGFLAGFSGLTLIDEVQRAPQLFLALKLVVDRGRRPGMFLLTGSANPLLLPQVADSLAGRMEICTLFGFSQGELVGRRDCFIDRAFQSLPLISEESCDLPEILVRGGFPEVCLQRSRISRRAAWFDAYLTSFIQRDLRDLAQISGQQDFLNLLKLLATRAAQPLNVADLSRQTGIQATTLRRYLSLLEATYLVGCLPAWSSNLGRRITKAPKVLIHDSGLLCHLLGLSAARLKSEPNFLGSVLENFVANELLRQLGWSETGARLFHFRAHSGEEVDLVLETPDGQVLGLEVKASSSLGASDWKGLRFLRDALGPKFQRGIVLYSGLETVPLGDRLEAAPVAALWA